MALPTCPGLYDFLDAVGGPAQLLLVREDAGTLVARFPVLDAREVPVASLVGEFRPAHRHPGVTSGSASVIIPAWMRQQDTDPPAPPCSPRWPR